MYFYSVFSSIFWLILFFCLFIVIFLVRLFLFSLFWQLPENLRAHYAIKEHASYSFLYYSNNKTTIIPNLKEKYDAYLDTNLAFQLQPTKLLNNNNIAIARLNARILLKNGVYLLTSLNKPLNSSNKRVLIWGNVDPTHLMRALEEREIVGSIEERESSDFSIVLTKPIEGFIQVRRKSVLVSCLDEKVSVLIHEALSSVCNII
ncbi:hypothetical protein LUZ60_011291 [Juncus effusus]|nr:hypothetical protein LUZ60_011291 [Juncus effusus]